MKNILAKIFNRLKRYSYKLHSFFYVPLFFDKYRILNIEKDKLLATLLLIQNEY